MAANNHKAVLASRARSFVWRLGGLAIAAAISLVLQALELYEVNPAIVGIVGLLVGEGTKYVNVNLPQLRLEEAQEDVAGEE